MNFAFIFDNPSKVCSRLEADKLDIATLGVDRFVWLDFDNPREPLAQRVLDELDIPNAEIDVLIASEPYYFKHRQNYLLNRMQICSQQDHVFVSSPLTIVMCEKAIVTFHPHSDPSIIRVSEEVEESFKAVGRTTGFIYFLLWNALIDGFLPQLFSISEQMDRLDEQILAGKVTQSIFNETLQCRHSIRILRSSLSPMQRIMRDLVNTRLELISDDARKFLTGLFEHMEWIAEAIDSLQESIFATLQGYHSSVSLQINNSMRLLSIIATIMMPLSLITAIYGTNFPYMPEFSWKYSYFVFLFFLFAVGLTMLFFFRRKHWL